MHVCGVKTLLTLGDIGDFYRKFRFKGTKVLGRLMASKAAKIAGTWDQTELLPSNWWNIPAVRARWEEKITGNPEYPYYQFVHDHFLGGKRELKMASPGCGTGSHERHFAPFPEIESVMAFDLSSNSITKAKQEGFPKIDYQVKDFYVWMEEPERYDLVFFYSSLHHFGDMDKLIPALKKKLEPGGLLILHEYTGPARMMWTKAQLKVANRLLRTLPRSYRRFAHGSGIKKKCYRPGLWRTLLTDPSESIESDQILPLIHTHFTCLYERGFGGNILHLLFKDIAHHFCDGSGQTEALLHALFEAEDRFLEHFPSDFHFGIYTPFSNQPNMAIFADLDK